MFDIDNFVIPPSVDIKPPKGKTVVYTVLWINKFKDENQIGECDYDNKYIIIKNDMDKWTTYWTFYHEVEHAISEEYGLKVTEKQVNGLEVGFSSIAEINGWYNPEKTKPVAQKSRVRKKCLRRKKKTS